MSRRDACHKSRSRRLFPVTAYYMCSLSISLKRHSQTNKSGPQRNEHVHRPVPSTPSCTGYVCHRLPPAALIGCLALVAATDQHCNPHPPLQSRPPPYPSVGRRQSVPPPGTSLHASPGPSTCHGT